MESASWSFCATANDRPRTLRPCVLKFTDTATSLISDSLIFFTGPLITHWLRRLNSVYSVGAIPM